MKKAVLRYATDYSSRSANCGHLQNMGSHPIFEALIPGLIVLVVAPLSAHNARTPWELLAATKAEIE